MALDWKFLSGKKSAPDAGASVLPDAGNPPAPSDSTTAAPPGSAAEGIVSERKRRKDAGVPRGSRGNQLSPAETQMAQAFAALYEPEVWENVMCGPADTMLAFSGKKLWEVSAQERKSLAITGAMTAKCFAVDNPKWLALSLLAIHAIQIYGSRIALHMIETKKEEKEAAEKAKRGTGAA